MAASPVSIVRTLRSAPRHDLDGDAPTESQSNRAGLIMVLNELPSVVDLLLPSAYYYRQGNGNFAKMPDTKKMETRTTHATIGSPLKLGEPHSTISS